VTELEMVDAERRFLLRETDEGPTGEVDETLMWTWEGVNIVMERTLYGDGSQKSRGDRTWDEDLLMTKSV
jgi:hypothetical protein